MRRPDRSDHAILSVDTLYDGWLTLRSVRMRTASGEEIDRLAIRLFHAVCVLPYDRTRRTALVVSMPRAPVALAGLPDMIEAIAGGVESIDPSACARREALEEAGVALGQLHHLGEIWPMPSNADERIDYFLAPYRATDRIAAGGGLAEEQENITVHELPLAALWRMVEDKSLRDGKLLTLLLFLRLREPDLFG